MGHYFQTKKGLRQGDPLSPILFNLIADMLAVLIERSKEMSYFDGLVPHLVEMACPSCNMRMTQFSCWKMI
jgi:hypothetical protein